MYTILLMTRHLGLHKTMQNIALVTRARDIALSFVAQDNEDGTNDLIALGSSQPRCFNEYERKNNIYKQN